GAPPERSRGLLTVFGLACATCVPHAAPAGVEGLRLSGGSPVRHAAPGRVVQTVPVPPVPSCSYLRSDPARTRRISKRVQPDLKTVGPSYWGGLPPMARRGHGLWAALPAARTAARRPTG